MPHPCTINLQVTGAQADTDTVKSAAESATFYETLLPGSPATEDEAITLWGTPQESGGLTVTENATDPDAVVINIDYTADYSPPLLVFAAIEALSCEVYCTYHNPTIGFAGIYSFGWDRAYHTFDDAFFLLPDGIILTDLYSLT